MTVLKEIQQGKVEVSVRQGVTGEASWRSCLYPNPHCQGCSLGSVFQAKETKVKRISLMCLCNRVKTIAPRTALSSRAFLWWWTGSRFCICTAHFSSHWPRVAVEHSTWLVWLRNLVVDLKLNSCMWLMATLVAIADLEWNVFQEGIVIRNERP